MSITPAYNEVGRIGTVLKELANYVSYRVVVDDGSNDNTCLEAINSGADVVMVHPTNMGQGYSLRTAMQLAREFNPDAVVSVDADLQHDVSCIPQLVAPINKGYDVVVGARRIELNSMPFIKRIGNFSLNIITRALFGIYCSDSQSGFRAYSRRASHELEFLIHRYGWASLMFAEMSEKHLKHTEVSIKCVYHNPVKGTTIWDGLWIGFQLVHYKFNHLMRRLR